MLWRPLGRAHSGSGCRAGVAWWPCAQSWARTRAAAWHPRPQPTLELSSGRAALAPGLLVRPGALHWLLWATGLPTSLQPGHPAGLQAGLRGDHPPISSRSLGSSPFEEAVWGGQVSCADGHRQVVSG